MTRVLQRELIHSSNLGLGYESLWVHAINHLQSTQKRKRPACLGANTMAAAYLVVTALITSRSSIPTIPIPKRSWTYDFTRYGVTRTAVALDVVVVR